MIRRFCDMCGNEITKKDMPGRNKLGRLNAEQESGKHKLRVEVIESGDGCSNSGDFCIYCVLDALQTLDDRPRSL
jgi:hypothetical protein